MITTLDRSKMAYPKEDRCPPTEGECKHASQNACKMCAPLGASLAFAGIKGCISILHGSQGCATYIRRYLISHFREPMDIASSSFSEEDAVFGGGRNLKLGIANVSDAYAPEVIGVATTCLAETIGEDVPQIIREYKDEAGDAEALPEMIQVSTPSYTGDHWEGYHKTVRAIVEYLAGAGKKEVETADGSNPLLVLPGMLSCEDFRYLKSIFEVFDHPMVLAPDYSDTLDGGSWSHYHRIPEGGTTLGAIREGLAGGQVMSLGVITNQDSQSAGNFLEASCGKKNLIAPLPMGIRATDLFLDDVSEVSGKEVPVEFLKERARLVDAYVDGHKYLSGKTAVVFSDPDMLVGLCSMLSEMGIKVLAAMTGSKVSKLEETVHEHLSSKIRHRIACRAGVDHSAVADLCREMTPDMVVGNSKGYPICREMGIPLIRCGMPIHDRMGAQRVLHLGYAGAQRFYDNIVNTLLEHRQDESDVGFSYL